MTPPTLPIIGQYEAIHQGLRFQRTALLVCVDMLKKANTTAARDELRFVEKLIQHIEKDIEGVEVIVFLRRGP